MPESNQIVPAHACMHMVVFQIIVGFLFLLEDQKKSVLDWHRKITLDWRIVLITWLYKYSSCSQALENLCFPRLGVGNQLVLEIRFSSDHNFHKSWCGFCFWISDPFSIILLNTKKIYDKSKDLAWGLSRGSTLKSWDRPGLYLLRLHQSHCTCEFSFPKTTLDERGTMKIRRMRYPILTYVARCKEVVKVIQIKNINMW